MHCLLVDLLYKLKIDLPLLSLVVLLRLKRLRVKLSELPKESHHHLSVCRGRIDVPLLYLLHHAIPLLRLVLSAPQSLEHYFRVCSHAGADCRFHLVEVLLLLLL